MSYSKLFYWLVVADNAKSFFEWGIWIFTVTAIISTAFFLLGRDYDFECPKNGAAERAKYWVWWSYPGMLLFWSLFIFTPSKKDALLIVAGGSTLDFLTTDSASKQIPKELTGFIVTELKSMAMDAKVDLNIKDQKNKLIEEAKTMSSEELLNRMKSDSTFSKIILDK